MKTNIEIQQWLIKNIAELKHIDEDLIETQRDFADLGLNSLQLIQMTGELEDFSQTNISETTLAEYATIASLAGYLGSQQVKNPDAQKSTQENSVASGENFNLDDFLKSGKNLSFHQRMAAFSHDLPPQVIDARRFLMRQIVSPADREVKIVDPFTNKVRTMLMFGSNNYLGLANDPYVAKKINEAIQKYGTGIGGPPLLNGYLGLHKELEQRLAALKHSEAAIVFPTGFATNLGLVNALANQGDAIIYDEYSHASLIDGMRLFSQNIFSFQHNNVEHLADLLEKKAPHFKNIFVGVEGVYSMDGDLAPLDKIVKLCDQYQAILMVDDAHGTGVLGNTGGGTAEHFNLGTKVEVNMGTFSKALASVGGFVAASKEIVEYLRINARSYMFSASLPPTVLAAVLAGLDIIEREPWRRENLQQNIRYATTKLENIGVHIQPEAGIIALLAPENLDMAKARLVFHQNGIFINSIEYPAVPQNKQRFRISMMAQHTKADIDRLVASVEEAVYCQTDPTSL